MPSTSTSAPTNPAHFWIQMFSIIQRVCIEVERNTWGAPLRKNWLQ